MTTTTNITKQTILYSRLSREEFVEKVIVFEADKRTGKRIQKVDIHLNFIGNFKPSEMEAPQEELPTTFIKRAKAPRLMAEEEREKLRDYDRERYTKKKAARIAKEEEVRAEILRVLPLKNSRQGALWKVPKLRFNDN